MVSIIHSKYMQADAVWFKPYFNPKLAVTNREAQLIALIALQLPIWGNLPKK